jgi:hypothetical protein
MPLRSKRSNQQYTRYWILYLVQHGVKMSAGYWKVSGALRKAFVRFGLSLHGDPLNMSYAAVFEVGP